MTENSSIGPNHQLYNTIRINDSNNTLHAWMGQILTYLASNREIINERQQLRLSQSVACDGSCDCLTNIWVREVSYEEHYRKLLMSRVNVGDTNLANSVDEDSLRQEASLVMESANHPTDVDEDPVQMDGEHAVPADIELINSNSDRSSDWEFVMYDSDNESEDSIDDPSYRPCGSELLKLSSEYSSDEYESEDDNEEDDDGTSSNYTYSIRMPVTFNASSINPARTVNVIRTFKNIRRPENAFDEDEDDHMDVYEYVYDDSEDDTDHDYRQNVWDQSSTN